MMSSSSPQTGLKRNWKQFSLLVLINAFVGAMVGLERTILPEIAEQEFGIAARSAIFSFIVVFGLTKAVSNYFAGRFATLIGRKRMLITGWLFGLPVPFILMYAPDWNWVVAANVLLGINQGLAWSANVIMKIDLAGEKDRGLAMGLNEFAGYVAVALLAFVTGWMATEFGLRPWPFIPGIALVLLGLGMTVFLVRDTEPYVNYEASQSSEKRSTKNLFWTTSVGDRNLMSISQAGLMTNFKDGVAWGVFPLFLVQAGLTMTQTGIVVAVYPAFWGILQVFTGKLSDYTGRKQMLYAGMLLQAATLLVFPMLTHFYAFLVLAALLGTGTAMVYPTFLASIADLVHPQDRAESVGVFRLWRDGGYAFGAIFAGLVADLHEVSRFSPFGLFEMTNLSLVLILTGLLTLGSTAWILAGMNRLNRPVQPLRHASSNT